MSAPVISAVMVSYGAVDLTVAAARAFRDHTPVPAELIIVDNGSDAATREVLEAVPDVRLILNDENRGFARATNQGAALARGQYLLLLNSDAFLGPGWFEPLAAVLSEVPGAAAVVPRLLHLDGSLQEAGVLLARDGSVLVDGDGSVARDSDAGLGPHGFRRELDSGSAACMLLERRLFADLGGLDERFSPAYYEDTDLCLRIRGVGRRVILEPTVAVRHVRYGSGGSADAATLAAANRARFVERWRLALADHPPSLRPGSPAAILARDAGARPRVLIIAPAQDPAAATAAAAVLERWPAARVSWWTETSARPPGLSPWVEVITGSSPDWLEQRRFHYDAVLCLSEAPCPGMDPLGRAELARTQPQAPRIDLSGAGSGQLDAVLGQLEELGVL